MILASLFLFSISFASAAPLSEADTQHLWQRSLTAYNQEDYKLSQKLLNSLVKAHPSNALYWFNLGNTYFMLKSYAQAEKCFLKVEALNSPLASAARLYRSKAMLQRGYRSSAEALLNSLVNSKLPPALHDEVARDLLALRTKSNNKGSLADEALNQYRKGQYKRALRTLSRIQSPDRDLRTLTAMVLVRLDREDEAFEILKDLQSSNSREIRELVDTLLDRLRDTYSRKSWLYIEAAGGWDSNFQRIPNAESAALFVADFGGGARWWTQNLWYANAGYYGHLYDIARHPSERVLVHELRANVGREIATDLLLFSPYMSHETYGFTAARQATGLAAKVRGGESSFEYGLDADWSLDRNLNAEYKYLAGTSQRYQVYLGRVQNPIYTRVSMMIEKKNIGSQSYTSGEVIPAAYLGLGPAARVLWKISRTWVTEANLNYVVRSYPNQALPDQKLRKDKDLSLSLQITNLLSKNISLYGSAEYTKNSSTLGASSVIDPNYSQFQFLMGALWDAN